MAKELGEDMTDDEVGGVGGGVGERWVSWRDHLPRPPPTLAHSVASRVPLSSPPPRPLPPQLAEMIEEADRNGDGAVDAEEFMRIMRKTALFGQ